MKCSLRTSFSPLAARLRLVFVAGLALLGGAVQAQTIQGPYPPALTGGAVPTPYSWPTYHAGGASPLTLDPTQTLGFLPPNPLAAQQQGLPTDIATNGTSRYITEISSFVLGNYDPTRPPSSFGSLAFGPTDPGFPNHFRDDNFPGGILSWSAPFTFLQATTTGTGMALAGVVLADDSDTTAFTYPTTAGFPAGWTVQSAFTNGWSTQPNTNADVSGNAGNMTTAGYQRAFAVNATSSAPTGTATATYTFDVPTGATGGYSVDFHLPPPVQNENRINNAHYVITLRHPRTAAPVTLFDGRIDQTSTTQPRQHIAGPFGLTAGDRVVVTLDNSSDPNKQTLPNPNTNVYVLADSVSLVEGLDTGTGATVQSSPTAISVDNFPEIADALYFGYKNTRVTPTSPPTSVADPNPYGNPTIGTANGDKTHLIRQLVYFGRTETIVLTNSTGGLVDAVGNSTTVPVSETVGAVYCVDGITGSVVWRFQAPDVLDNKGNVVKRSAGVSSAPAVARLNVLTSSSPTPTYSTKLCVIAADDNGLVYCLDAIGNRNGTSNLGVNEGGTDVTNPVTPIYNQPIYSPGALLNTGAAQDTTPHAHVGNTQVYWIYRPDPNASLNTNNNQTAPHPTNPSSDLPVPQAFGLASPTVYVDPTVATATATLAPASPPVSDPAAVTSNAVVYIGNSNGTLYALDALGVPPSDAKALYNRSLSVGIKSAGFTLPAGEPTVTPNWWLPINHGQTNNPDATGNVSITSTPAILQTAPITGSAQTTQFKIPARPKASSAYTIYVTTANDDNNVGRLYAVSNTGPVGGVALGFPNYNANASANWAFPDLKHNPLGSITGSPVVFTNPDDRSTNVYMAANVGIEYKGQGLDAPAIAGRIWAVHSELSGISDVNRAIWAYPDTFNPNANPPSVNPTVTLGGTTITNPATDLPQPLGSFENATPAIGVVQFPTNIVYGTGTPQTAYTHTDNASVSPTAPNQRTSTNVLGQKVPMLYVGSRDAAQDSIGSTFYALDLDGNTTTQRDIFDFGQGTSGTPAPLGTVFTTDGFLSAPLLITNATDTSNAASIGIGNGGAVFITGSDNNLYEVGATPTSGDANSTAPQLLPLFLRLPGFGSLSSPSAAAYNTADLVVTSSGGQLPSTTRVVTEWVYGGDDIAGVARGITPANRPDSGGTINYGTGGPPVDFNAPPIILPYHAHVYVFDNTSAHNAMSTDMSTANKIGASIAAFEWGTNAYLRVSNVVPPNPTNDPSRWVVPPNENPSNLQKGDIVFSNTNNSPVNINISDVDPRTGKPADTATYRSDASTGTSVFPSTTMISPPETNGFYPESGAGELDGNTTAGGTSTNGDMLIGATSKPWIGAATYSINPTINGKPDTPGARRRVIQAMQKNIGVYVVATSASTTGGVFTQAVLNSVPISTNTTIDVFTDSSQQTTTRDEAGVQKFQTIAKQQQPTFGVLNPIAVRGGGYPIQVARVGNIPENHAIAIGPTPASGGPPSLLGPFGGVQTPLSVDDIQALTNGNSIYVSPASVPTSGTISPNTGRRVHVDVITATSPIAHGTAGDNGDPNNTTTLLATSKQDALYGTTNGSMSFGAYGLTIADRSALGTPPSTGAPQTLSNLKVTSRAVQWNDNVGTGPAAVVNPLPWEDTTSISNSSNGSLDYPDMPGSSIRQTLYAATYGAQNISGAAATPDPASPNGGTVATRNVHPNPVQVQIRVLKYQPANLQIYNQSAFTPAGPDALAKGMDAFPMGYVSRESVYVDNGVGSPRNKAHRDILVYTGVPVDMTTTIVNQTTDLGKLPHSFGIQTDQYVKLNPPLALGYGFMPYNGSYSNPGYFKPLTVLNQGNVNLLNVHFDQQQYSSNLTGNGSPSGPTVLPLMSDALDPLAPVPSYDDPLFTGLGFTGPGFVAPGANLPGTMSPANPFLVRTSLDTDLGTAYGLNPGIRANATLSAAYPGATFHKARPGDASPSLLTVPDVPRASSAATAGPPTLTASFVPQNAALPYIGLAVPLGTPVGTYSANVSVFEGMDVDNYTDIYNTGAAAGGNLYKPLVTPKYGGIAVDGQTKLATTPTNSLYKVTVTGGTVYGQPVSTPTRLKATITETLVTSGNTYGNLPQVDTTGAGVASANFLPAAFRNAYWSNGALSGTGDLSLYWVTARGNTTPNTTPPYNIAGYTLPYVRDNINHTGYFSAAAPASRWFQPATANANGLLFPNTLTGANAGVNTALSIAADQHLYNGASFSSDGTAFAFVTHLSGTAPYQNSLFCYPVTTGTGSLGLGVPVTTDTRQPRFGVRGLKFVAPSDFTDALGTNKVDNNLWAFWNNGSRGRSTLFYSSAQSADLAGYTTPTPFNAPAALPLPAGLSSASDPSAVLVQDGVGTSLAHMIEVTYTGVGADGNADIYVSRYRPYFTRNANRGIRTDPNGHNAVSLALVGGPPITEQLMPDGARQYYQARDVAWARNAKLDVQVAGATNGTPPATNSVLLDANNKPVNPVYDPASGFLVYNGVSSPAYIATGGTEQITAVYVDLARGRVRFRTSYTKTGATTPSLYDVPLPADASVTATFQSQARRITTDSRADTEPVSFIDEAFKSNEGNIKSSDGSYPFAGFAGRAKTDRYWFIWRKSAAPGTSTTPTLYTKTQRLTAALLDGYGKPISVTLDSNGAVPPVYTPHVNSVTINTQTVFTQAAGSQNEGADIDWARGRIYFPLVVNGQSTEGQQAKVVCSYIDSQGAPHNNQTLTVPVYWLDEQRLNDPSNAPANPNQLPIANLAPVDTTEHAVPIDIATNEGSVSAFLDPFAYADVASGAYDPYGSDTANNHADQLHKVWLFWNSTRNGTADIYYETIAPRFSVKP